MTLRRTFDLFLESVSEKSKDVYSGKINCFYNFLVEKKGITDGSFQSYLSSMRDIEILESLQDYIDKNELTKISVALHYISVVRRYFNFLYGLQIENNNLLRNFSLEKRHNDSFTNKLREFIKNNNRLTDIGTKSALTLDEVKLLLIECDQEIEDVLRDRQIALFSNINKTTYNNIMSAVALKLIVFTGIKFNILNTIRIGDLNISHNTICINNFTIHLPDNLADQFENFLSIRKSILSESDVLFIKYEGDILGRSCSILSERLQQYIGRQDTTGITKFGVIEMIKKGVNQSILQEFTGVGMDIFKDCQRQVNGEKNKYGSRYLDSKLRSLEINDLL